MVPASGMQERETAIMAGDNKIEENKTEDNKTEENIVNNSKLENTSFEEKAKSGRSYWYDDFDENDMTVEYVVDRVIDKEKLAEYLKEARGDRKMFELAELCDTKPNPSTFSRILKYKITRPLKPELIRDIISHAAPSFHTSYYDFMKANGMSPKIEVQERKDRWEKQKERWGTPDLKEEEPIGIFKSKVKNKLLEELTMRGCVMIPMKRIPTEGAYAENLAAEMPRIPKGVFELYYSGSFTLYMPSEKPVYWNFMFVSIYEKIRARTKEFFDSYARIFLRDVWEPETLKDVKTSFVFWENKDDYEKVKEIFTKRTVNSHMSLIYLSQDESQEPEEWMIPVKGGEGQKQSLFDKKKIDIFGDDEDEKDIFAGDDK